MRKLFYTLATLAIAIALFGCGGAGRDGRGTAGAPVSITESGLAPGTFRLAMGSVVTWTNNSSRTVKIVSGRVGRSEARTPPPLLPTVREFTVEEGGSFAPVSRSLDLGLYEVGWLNSSGGTVTLQIRNEDGALVRSNEVANGAMFGCELSAAGTYTFCLSSAPTVTGKVIMSGTPYPDGKFESPYLLPGQTYSTVVDAAGFQGYYVIDQAAPDTSHVVGTIVEML